MSLVIQGKNKKEFDEIWNKYFPMISQEELFGILSNNIFINDQKMEYLNVSINEWDEFDFYHDKAGEMRYTYMVTISPKNGELIQKHFYPNSYRMGKYAQFLYNCKLACDVADLDMIRFYVPNHEIAENLENIGADKCNKIPNCWQIDFRDTDEMEMYFDRKNVLRLSEYEKDYNFVGFGTSP